MIAIKVVIIDYPNEFAVDELIHQAVNASDKEFVGLIKRAILLLNQEQSAPNSTHVDGRLVRLPQSGEAIVIADLHGDLHSLAHILKSSGFMGKAEKAVWKVGLLVADLPLEDNERVLSSFRN